MEWHLAKQKPINYQKEQPDDVVFCDNQRYYIGRINFDGKWFDYASQDFKDDIDAWAYLPGQPITFGDAEVISEWNIGSGPVTQKFKHFLLYDQAIGEIVYKDIDSTYFDSKRQTFPEVSHWIVLPDLPLHYRNIHEIQRIKASFLHLITQKLGIDAIELEPFNEECLSQSIGELVNTTINGVPQIETLSEAQLPLEILTRWNDMIDLWFKNSENGRVRFTFGTTAVPETMIERDRIRTTLTRIAKALHP
jgi:hypothetical protein